MGHDCMILGYKLLQECFIPSPPVATN